MLLSFAANQAAIAFENARLSEHRDRTDAELRRAHQRLELMVAERTEQLAVLADEQAALRRMATLIAEGAPPTKIFSATCEEIRRLVGSETAAVCKFEHEPPAIVVVGIAQGIGRIPMQTRSSLVPGLASSEVYRTGRAARVDGRNWSFFEEPVLEGVAREAVSCTVATPIAVEGRLWGTMSVSGNRPFPPDTEQRLERFTELLATAIANADGKAELAASRVRIIAASDEARRQIERDLHDGTQQRLVSLGLALRAAADQAPPDSSLRHDLSRIGDELSDAVTELQELSRGVHPAVLSKGGLGPALRSLARRSVVPVELDLRTDARLPEPIEVAAFYVVSEALANAAKHARASIIDVCLESDDGNLVLSVRDDGVGGADLGGGSGLAGLADRVEALGGSFDVRSEPGNGTRITAELPVDLAVPESSQASRPR
jgi:signal transduction histidine kinase